MIPLPRRSLVAVSGAALALAACQPPVTFDGRFPILAVLDARSDLSEFRSALRRAGLDQLLSGPGPFTVFAPTNRAWSAASPAFREGGAEALRHLIAAGRLRMPDIAARNNRVRMLSGSELRIVGGTPAAPRIQAARPGAAPSGPSGSIIRPDILCSNGVVHVVDTVPMPA